MSEDDYASFGEDDASSLKDRVVDTQEGICKLNYNWNVLFANGSFFSSLIKLFLLIEKKTMKTSAVRRAHCYPAGNRHHTAITITSTRDSSTINMPRAMNLAHRRDS